MVRISIVILAGVCLAAWLPDIARAGCTMCVMSGAAELEEDTAQVRQLARRVYQLIDSGVKRRPGGVSFSGLLNELALAVQLGNVDAVICWDTNARHFSAHGDIVAIPREENVISPVPIVVLKCSKAPDAAREFVEFVRSEKGREILTANNYTVSLDK